MLNGLRKIFGGIRMTWVKVIIFAIITAVVTSVILLVPALAHTALVEMGTTLEFWFIFAIFIISNCQKMTEAGIKTFVFFLISQPLIYLIQQPFASVNLLAHYYFYWFIWTILTLPGGMIAFYIKGNNLLAALVLAVAGLYLGIYGTVMMVDAIVHGKVSYIIYGAFFMVSAIVLGLIFLTKKKILLIYLALIIPAIIGAGVYSYIQNFGSGSEEYNIQHTGTWEMFRGSSSNGLDISFVDGDTILITHPKSFGTAEFELKNEKDETLTLKINVEYGKVNVEEKTEE